MLVAGSRPVAGAAGGAADGAGAAGGAWASTEPQNSAHDTTAVETALIETSLKGETCREYGTLAPNYNHLRE
jgi:hypothetical protein